MVIDATHRFARRSATWMLKSGMTGVQLQERLKIFSESHVTVIGEQVRDIRGQRKLPK